MSCDTEKTTNESERVHHIKEEINTLLTEVQLASKRSEGSFSLQSVIGVKVSLDELIKMESEYFMEGLTYHKLNIRDTFFPPESYEEKKFTVALCENRNPSIDELRDFHKRFPKIASSGITIKTIRDITAWRIAMGGADYGTVFHQFVRMYRDRDEAYAIIPDFKEIYSETPIYNFIIGKVVLSASEHFIDDIPSLVISTLDRFDKGQFNNINLTKLESETGQKVKFHFAIPVIFE